MSMELGLVVEIVERPTQLWKLNKCEFRKKKKKMLKKAPSDLSVNPSFHGYGWQKNSQFSSFFLEKDHF